jgi:hypothetical protein
VPLTVTGIATIIVQPDAYISTTLSPTPVGVR